MTKMGRSLPYAALLVLSALPSIQAHVAMSWPIPFGADKLATSRDPLRSDTYPCRKDAVSGWEPTAEQLASNVIETNREYELTFGKVAAVHAGGSCQLSITLDAEPTAKSVFKTFYSIIGGCPGVGDGADVRPQPFMLPASIPAGNVTLAWSWFPAHSGSYEMYMNCAPITVPDGADDTSGFDALPDMLVANVPSTNADASRGADDQRKYLDAGEIPPCSFSPDAVVHFPNPGNLFSTAAGTVTAAAVSEAPATACGAKGATTTVTAAGKLVAAAAGAVAPAATKSSAAAPSAGNGGGAFVEASATAAAAPSAASTTSFLTSTVVQNEPTSVSTPAGGDAAVTPVSIGSVDTPVAATPTPGSSDSDSDTSAACKSASDGQMVCKGTSQFGICNWGKVVWENVAAGTVCENGTIKASKVAARGDAAAPAEMKGRRSHMHAHAHGRLSGRRQFYA